jgi:hypothetical protein
MQSIDPKRRMNVRIDVVGEVGCKVEALIEGLSKRKRRTIRGEALEEKHLRRST